MKPSNCPFCGGETSVQTEIINKTQYHRVTCNECHIFTAGYLDSQKAIEAWNRRISDWIPVSERLPENGQKALWTLNDGHISIEVYIASAGVGCAIAWMPLPEPWREGK